MSRSLRLALAAVFSVQVAYALGRLWHSLGS